jgi:DNA helicase-2/ATP-dependent DNA helicase PcrA
MDWEREQEKNLCYVAATRSMSELVELLPPAPRVQKPANDNPQPKTEKAA